MDTFLNAIILIFTLKLIFYHWPPILSIVFLQVIALLLFIFEKVPAIYPSLNNRNLSVLRLRGEKWRPIRENAASSLGNSNSLVGAFLESPLTSWFRAECLMHASCFISRYIKRHVHNSQGLMDSNILMRNWYYFLLGPCSGRQTPGCYCTLVALPRCMLKLQWFYPTCHSHHYPTRKANNILVFFWQIVS